MIIMFFHECFPVPGKCGIVADHLGALRPPNSLGCVCRCMLYVVAFIGLTGLVSAFADSGTEGNKKKTGAEAPISEADLVRIEMQEHDKVHFEGKVSDSGTVRIPYYGEFRIAGFRPANAEKALEQELTKELYYRATISVTVIERSPGKIFVYGAVKEPGMVSLLRYGETSMLQVLSSVGGLNRWAVPKNAYILRGQDKAGEEERIEIDLSRRIHSTSAESKVSLQAGDILFVPGLGGDDQRLSAEGVEVIVVGQVNRPGIVGFAPGERHTMMRAIFKAGGLSEFAKAQEVKLIRYTTEGEREVKLVDMEAVLTRGELTKDVPVQTGDMVLVPAKIFNF